MNRPTAQQDTINGVEWMTTETPFGTILGEIPCDFTGYPMYIFDRYPKPYEDDAMFQAFCNTFMMLNSQALISEGNSLSLEELTESIYITLCNLNSNIKNYYDPLDVYVVIVDLILFIQREKGLYPNAVLSPDFFRKMFPKD